MKNKLWLALLPVFCLCGQSVGMRALAVPQSSVQNQQKTGRIEGVLKDPSGAVVRRARVVLHDASLGTNLTHQSDQMGRFVFDGLPAGRYEVRATVPGFATALLRNVAVADGRTTTADVTLQIATASAEVRVVSDEDEAGRSLSAGERARRHNVADLAADEAGVALRTNGELATAPVLHGMGTERNRVVVNGATVSSSCPNYMNDPLSYASSARAATVKVLAGLTPVSMGGDSLGGTIAVDSNAPVFASDQHLLIESSLTGFTRSNGQAYGGALNEWIANRHFAFGYTGTWALNEDYTDGSGHKVTSTYAQSTNHVVTLASAYGKNLFEVEGGIQNTPYEGFVNAQMDMTRNWSELVNAHFRHTFAAGTLDGRVYWQGAWHGMNVGRDKITFPMAMWMPMNTHGRDLGYSITWMQPLGVRHMLHLGNDMHRFRLDDTWPPVAGSGMMMSPDTFIDINNGRRTRMGTFAELDSKWSPKLATILGLREDTVWTNADAVSGYSSMYASDAASFNASKRSHADPMLDVTATAHYDATPLVAIEAGFARKNRAPNLYERYAWSKMWMAAMMIGWYGDGNAYVGNVNLQPESANLLTGSLRLRGRSTHAWQLKASPYVNFLNNYIDVDQIATDAYTMTTIAELQFANHAARIYGGDLSGNVALWDGLKSGLGTLRGSASWLHGERTDSKTPLYQMMPLNAKLDFTEEWHELQAGMGVEAVDKKHNVDPNRFEQQTPGYTLFNLHASYRKGILEAGGSADNLLNKCYELPLGGVNEDDFQSSMEMNALAPLTGRGRSFSFSLNARF
ncbi:TonB-dependent receptor [Telmatobacter bradus]|uniref:TonB-dependent receptor n=1 Tax=Telmatobacter bradus TaxID=474953 RepID=UPI003B42FAA2